MDVGVWLEGLGLGEYAQAFVDEAIDQNVLLELTDADLEKLHVRLGHRKKLLAAIAALKTSATPPAQQPTAVPASATGQASPPTPAPQAAQQPAAAPGAACRLFISYGRRDASQLAERLCNDLQARGFDVWLDRSAIRSGSDFMQVIQDGLRSTQVVVALLSPHAVRRSADPQNLDTSDSVCLDELHFARFGAKKPIVPVLAAPCEPPFVIYRLDYVDMQACAQAEDRYLEGFKRLLNAIADAQRGVVHYRSWEDDLRPWDFTPLLEEKRRNFVGRQWLLDEIDAWRTTDERALLITGDPGTGKSAIVSQLVHLNPGGQVLAYHCCQADTLETLKPARFVRSVAAMVASKLDGYAAQLSTPAIKEALSASRCESDPLGAFEEGLLAPLQQLPAPPEGVRYLLIDALDEAMAQAGQVGTITLVDVLASRLNRMPPWLRVVATTRKEPAVLSRLRGLRARELDAQDPRNLNDLERYVTARLGTPNLAERLKRSQRIVADVARVLREKSAGNFLYVVQALDGVERDQYGFGRLEELPPGLGGLYENFFARHFRPREAGFEERFAPSRRVLQVIAAARGPLGKAFLTAATELDAEGALARVLRTLAAYLPEREGGVCFYHKSLGDWLTGEEQAGGDFYISAKEGHARLAQAGWAEYQAGTAGMSRYVVEYLPAHLLASGRLDDVERLLTDIFFLERRNVGLVFSLASDFAAAVEAMPLNRPGRRTLGLLEEALRRDVHFIARHAQDYPHALFQCLWNSCWWYDCPETERHYIVPESGWKEPQPWAKPTLAPLLEKWRAERERAAPGFHWVRSLRPPPMHLGTAQKMALRGHESGVNSVAFSPEDRRIVSGSSDKTVRVWDAETGAELHCLGGHEANVNSVAFSPEGQRIVSGGDDKTVRVWEVSSGAELHRLRGHGDGVRSVAFSPDGQRIVSGGNDKTVRIWDAGSGAAVHCLRGHHLDVSSVAFSPNGQRILSGSYDGTVRVWETGSGAELHCLQGHKDGVWSVAFSNDGQRIVSGSMDATVRVWAAGSGAELHCLRGHEGWISGVAFSNDGHRILSGSHDGTVRVWDAESGAELHCLQGHDLSVTSAAFSANGQRIVSGSWDNTVRVWEAGSGVELRCLRGHDLDVTSAAFSADGQYIVSGSYDKTVRVWEAGSGAELRCLRGHENPVTSLAFSPGGKQIVSGSYDKTLRIWKANSGAELNCLRGHLRSVESMVLSPDGQRIVSGSADNSVRVWEAGSGAELRCLRGHEGVVRSVAFSPDGQRILSGSEDHTVRVWDADSGAELHCLRGHGSTVRSVAFSRDGQRILGESRNKSVRVWDVQSGECLQVFQGETGFAAVAAGAQPFPWRALASALDTVIADGGSGPPAAWFNSAILDITTHPSGRVWAGGVGSYFCLIKLEGVEGIVRCSSTPVRLWLFGSGGDAGQWDDHLTAICPWCGRRFAFGDPLPLGQDIPCPLDGCGKLVKVDTVVCDNRGKV